MMAAYANRAVKSPCYACDTFKKKELRLRHYPGCADACQDMAAYRRYQGLPEVRQIEPVTTADLNREARSPVEFTGEALAAIAFLETEKKRLRISYPDLAALMELPVHRVQGIAQHRYKRIRPDVAAKIEAYRQKVREHGSKNSG